MNLYRIDYRPEGGSWVCSWRGTQASAKQTQRYLEGAHGVHNVVPYKLVEVPTAKPDLLEWLNENAVIPMDDEDNHDTTGAGNE